MYYYIYDPALLVDNKYEKELNRIEGRLTDLGINGNVGRFPAFNGVRGAVKEELKKGIKTVVIVGNDESITRIVDMIADLDVVLGVIPIGKKNKIANILGVKGGEDVCDLLAARTIEKLDLGKINDKYFVGCLEIEDPGINLECEGRYNLSLVTGEDRFHIYNLGCVCEEKSNSNAKDGYLEICLNWQSSGFLSNFFSKFKESQCFVGVNKINIKTDKDINIKIDCYRRIAGDEFKISISSNKLKVIVGKGRRI